MVAAAVVLPARPRIKGLRDSKVLSRAQRERLYEQITERADAIGVGCVEVDVIDRINILQATKVAMREAIAHLPEPPDHLLIDALTIREAAYPQRAIIDGDAISASIAAASIVAKVTRDRICDEMDGRFPAYGFARHKGYGTRAHYAALVREGPCEWHRRSFAPFGCSWPAPSCRSTSSSRTSRCWTRTHSRSPPTRPMGDPRHDRGLAAEQAVADWLSAHRWQVLADIGQRRARSTSSRLIRMAG